jgi:hypothetical protein
MSRHASRFLPRGVGLVAGVLTFAAPPAFAQTIADYSRAQRAALEGAMAQAAARSAGLGAPVPAVAASVAASPAPAPAHAAMPLPAPDLQVSGAFASSRGAVAEVVVDGTAYLLEVGERVPGTAWEVRLVAFDRVVLARLGSAASSEPSGGQRVFALPALR